MEEAKSRSAAADDRSQAAAEKLRALRERANQALDDHRQRLRKIESELSLRIQQLADDAALVEESSRRRVEASAQANAGAEAELETLRCQVEEGREQHRKFTEQLAAARRQLDAIQNSPCDACEESARQLADAHRDAEQLRSQLAATESQLQAERDRHDDVVRQVAAARQSLNDLRAKSDDDVAALERELQEALDARQAESRQVEALRGELVALHAECEALERRNAALEQQGAAEREHHETQQGRAELLEQQLAESHRLRMELECERQAIGAELASLKYSVEHGQQEQAAQAAAVAKQAEADRRQLAAADDARAAAEAALAEAVARRDELQSTLGALQSEAERLRPLAEAAGRIEPLQHQLAEAQQAEQAQAAEADRLKGELAALQSEFAAAKASTAPRTEIAEIQKKLDLSQADVAKLTQQCSDLREEVSRLAEASEAEPPELIAVRSERDGLAAQVNDLTARVKELEAAPAIPDSNALREQEDLRRRYEMAVEDVRQYKQENAQLREQLASAGSGAAAPAPGNGPLNWAAQKAQLLAMLEQEDGVAASEPARRQERVRIEETIAATDRIIAEHEARIAELEAREESAADSAESAERQQIDAILDADEMIAAQRQRLAQLETEWEAKHRAAELEFSLERAKLAREQAMLKAKLSELNAQMPPADAEENKSRRRWRVAFGLNEDGDKNST